MPVIIICKQCGKEVKVTPSRASQKHCSKKCRGISAIGVPFTEERKANISKALTGGRKRRQGYSLNHGYMRIYVPEHPFSTKKGYVFEHRLIAEKCLGRYLDSTEKIHHIDFNPLNNSPENIFVFENNAEHSVFHQQLLKNSFLKTWLKSNIMHQSSCPSSRALQ